MLCQAHTKSSIIISCVGDDDDDDDDNDDEYSHAVPEHIYSYKLFIGQFDQIYMPKSFKI